MFPNAQNSTLSKVPRASTARNLVNVSFTQDFDFYALIELFLANIPSYGLTIIHRSKRPR